MEIKINDQKFNKTFAGFSGKSLKYKNDSSPWGLSAFYEGCDLVFSGYFKNSTRNKNKIGKIFSFFPSQKEAEQNKIVAEVDIYTLFSPSAKKVWHNAVINAKKRKIEVGVEEIFLALLKQPSIKNLLARLKVKTAEAEVLINNYLKLMPPLTGPALQKIPFEAFSLATELHNHKIGSIMLLGGLYKATPKDNILHAIFTNIGLTEAKLELFAVWLLDLNYQFAPFTTSDKLLFCLRLSQNLEHHFGYFFELPAIEAAVELSENQTLKDLQHHKAMQYLIKAGAIAQVKKTKIITEALVRQAAKK